ncbi:MAG: sulfotransferase [Pseudomonadota bacterium]
MANPRRPEQNASIRAFYEHALAHKKAGDLDEAERTLRRAVAIYQRDPNILCLLGEVSLEQRRPQESRRWFLHTLELFPGYPRALEGAGKTLLAEKKPKKAADYLRRAAEALPNRVTTQLALGRACSMSGQAEEAEAAIARALALDPARALAVNAAEALAEGRAQEAEKLLRDHLAQNPDDPLALRLLARVAMDSGRRGAAIRLLERCIEHAPDFVLAHNDLADLYMKEDRFDDALASVERSLALDPALAHSWVFKGNVLSRSQQHDEAIAAYDHAMALSPAHSGAMAGKGHVLKTVGRADEAVEVFRACIRAHPSFGEPWWSLANLKTFSFDPEEVTLLEELVHNESLGEEARVNMRYALAKHRENEERYAEAMAHYQAGATLRRPNETYDPVQNQVLTDHIIEAFSADFLRQREGWGSEEDAPILIVGLPRSGSTLIEQILASHPAIDATIELGDLGRCVRAVSRAQQDKLEYPQASVRLRAEDVLRLSKRYLRGAGHYRGEAPYFIDKMPNNFQHLGFMHLMFPRARFIDARRHPLDSCLGSYKQLFYRGQSFTYDWFELGQFYLQYRRLMDHWKGLFPERVLDVRYEDVVRDQEGQTRRMLDFLGLEFDERCLRFWETDRAINTASSEQVRRPIYTKGLNFWRHYESELDELVGQLEPLLRDLPPEDRPLSLGGDPS